MTTQKNCVIFLSKFDYYNDWSYFYADAFDQLGYDVSFIPNQEAINFNAYLSAALEKNPDFFLGLNAEGNNIKLDGNYIYDIFYARSIWRASFYPAVNYHDVGFRVSRP